MGYSGWMGKLLGKKRVAVRKKNIIKRKEKLILVEKIDQPKGGRTKKSKV